MKSIVLSLSLLLSISSFMSCDKKDDKVDGKVPKVQYNQYEGEIDGDTVSIETAKTTNEVNFLEESYFDEDNEEVRIKYGEDANGKYAEYTKEGKTYHLPQVREDETGRYYEDQEIKLHSTDKKLNIDTENEKFSYNKR